MTQKVDLSNLPPKTTTSTNVISTAGDVHSLLTHRSESSFVLHSSAKCFNPWGTQTEGKTALAFLP